MSKITVDQEHEPAGRQIDELALREITPLEPGHDERSKPHRSNSRVQKALAISYIAFCMQ